jgi:hypothetical protein
MLEALLATYERGRRPMPETPPLQGDLFQWDAPTRVEETDARESSQVVSPFAERVQPADPEPGTPSAHDLMLLQPWLQVGLTDGCIECER